MKQTLVLEIDLDNIDLTEAEFEEQISETIDLILADKENEIKDPVKYLGELLAGQKISLDLILLMASKIFIQMLKILGPARAMMKIMEENDDK